jgi:two-component system chemotaxis response regulator CheY
MSSSTSTLNPLRYSKILIVDDSKEFRTKIKRIFKDAQIGRRIYEAVDGQEGISKYIAYKPNLVIMDIMMPNVDGVKATQAIMKFDPNAKIIIISAKKNRAIVHDVVNKYGAKDYVLKPFDSGQVIMAVSKQLVASRLKKSKPTFSITPTTKPLMYNGMQYGFVDNKLVNDQFVVTVNPDMANDKLLERAQGIEDMGNYCEIVL